MNIDLTKFRTHWYELCSGEKVDEIPEGYDGYVYYISAFPCRFSEEISLYNYHPKNFIEKWLLKHFPKLQKKWNVTRERTFQPIATFHNGYHAMSDVIVAMVNAGDYTLEEAIWICATCCERCMNALTYKYLDGKDGYPEHSEEWKKCNTVCDFCREE